jgi:hypothetical protein
MQKHVLAALAAAFMLGCGPTAATAQGLTTSQPVQPQGEGASGGGQGYAGGCGYHRWHMMQGGFSGGVGAPAIRS